MNKYAKTLRKLLEIKRIIMLIVIFATVVSTAKAALFTPYDSATLADDEGSYAYAVGFQFYEYNGKLDGVNYSMFERKLTVFGKDIIESDFGFAALPKYEKMSKNECQIISKMITDIIWQTVLILAAFMLFPFIFFKKDEGFAVYSDLYRIASLKTENGTALKLAICGITVKDKLKETGLIGFPLYNAVIIPTEDLESEAVPQKGAKNKLFVLIGAAKQIAMVALIACFALTTTHAANFTVYDESWMLDGGTEHVAAPAFVLFDMHKYLSGESESEQVTLAGAKLTVFGNTVLDSHPEEKFDLIGSPASINLQKNKDIFKFSILMIVLFELIPAVAWSKKYGYIALVAGAYRIIKLKKPNPDKDGEFIKGKKIAICGITVRDDCPDEVFLGFPTYKKSYKRLRNIDESVNVGSKKNPRKTQHSNNFIVLKIHLISIITIILFVPFFIPRATGIDSVGSKSTLYIAKTYRICYFSELSDSDSELIDYNKRIEGTKISVLGFRIVDTCPGYFENHMRAPKYERHPLISALSYQLRVHSIMIWIWYVVSAIWLTIPKKIKLPDRNAVCRYADLYRIIKFKKPNPDKDGEFIEGKKIAICGITVRDDCPDEVFLGFPTYKKSRKMLEKDEGGGG